MVYCEFSVGMPSRSDVDAAVSKFALERVRTQDTALFRAATAFKEYRARGGPKNSLLPDFLIGATAAVLGAPLVTANARDFVGYFPEVPIIAP
jgi:predicted nucleic acid-binding protein